MTGAPIKVMIVDDAVVVRRMLADLIGSDPELDVVGTASNGRLALPKVDQLDPDVVILDIEMPELDGLGTVTELRKTHRRLPIIMFSTLTEHGATSTLEALARGANDYVTKPANVGSVTLAMQRIRDELIPKIKQFRPSGAARATTSPGSLRPAPPRSLAPGSLRPAPPRTLTPPPGAVPPRPSTAAPASRTSAAPPTPAPFQRPTRVPGGPVEAIGIVSSTGGPNALAELIPALPADLRVPVLIVQHMPPVFTSMLAKRLDGLSQLRVAEGEPGKAVEPGTVWIAPGGLHMVVKRVAAGVALDTNTDPPENSCRPAGDVLLRSMASIWSGRLLVVALTGMGADGAKGAEQVAALGGQVVAQDEATSVVWGIPGNVVKAGVADSVLPLDRIAGEITARVLGGKSRAGRTAGSRP
jgi:two-component system chemotaxis response regulator CheB